MNRLTSTDLELIRHHLEPFRHFRGLGALLDKIDAILAETASSYIKVVRLEFVPAPESAPPPAESLARLTALGCQVLRQPPPAYVLQVPDHGPDFDAAIDLLESMHHRGLIRYHG